MICLHGCIYALCMVISKRAGTIYLCVCAHMHACMRTYKRNSKPIRCKHRQSIHTHMHMHTNKTGMYNHITKPRCMYTFLCILYVYLCWVTYCVRLCMLHATFYAHILTYIPAPHSFNNHAYITHICINMHI